MKNASRLLTASVITPAVLTATLLLAQAPTAAQTPATNAAAERDAALKAMRLARQLQANGRVLTMFDRQGKVVAKIGEPAIYDDVVISPDGTRLAVSRVDLEARTADVWVLDVATGKNTRITSSQPREGSGTPVWSPDGTQLAYWALRRGYSGVYRKASNGTGAEELLYQHPGSNLGIRDWSLDGRFLSFSTTDLSGGTLYALPLAGNGARTPTVVLRSASQLRGSSFSPDNRFLSYTSDESGKNEIYVRPFDPSAGGGAASATRQWQISDQGGQWALYSGWRRDGKEMYYLAPDGGVMAVEVSTAQQVQFGKPKLLFRLSQAVTAGPGLASATRDGQRIVVAVPPTPVLQQMTVFDRQGKILGKVPELGRYSQLTLSPDGAKMAVMKTDPRQGDLDIWSYDVATGTGTPVTDDLWPENAPIWSPDGRHVAYGSTRGKFSSIYRKPGNGIGDEEQVFQYTPGAGLVLTDWSPDGKFLTFHDGCSGVLNLVSLTGNQKPIERQAIEWLRDEYSVAQARFSPDSSFMAYLSNEGKSTEEINSGINEVYVRPFDATKSDVSSNGEKPIQVSTAGALGMIVWRQDGKELYYLTPSWEVMAVDVTTTPAFHAGIPRLLFKVPVGLPGPFLFGNPQQWKNVSADGQRFAFAINVPASVSAR